VYFYSELFNKSITTFIKYYEINYFFNSIYFNSFISAIREVNQNGITKEKQSKSNENILLKTWFANLNKEFDEKLRYDSFINLLNNYINSSLDLLNNMTNNVYLNPQLIYHGYFDLYLKYFYSPFISYSKELNLSDNDIIFQKDNIKLLHYINNNQQAKGSGNNILLIIYAPINRFHILDLNPSTSVVRTLLSNGIDVYLLDWGYPDKKDNMLTLKDYVDYIDDAVDAIKQSISKSYSSSTIKISILGYCWGGITSLIYTAFNQIKINKLILMATPIDFSKDNTTISMWSKSVDTDKIIDTFGHFDGYFLDYIFNIRNPVKFLFAKYFNLWKNLDNKEFVNTFFDVEKWLHDTPPIPGELYKKIVNDCYKNNLLVKGNMKLDERKIAKEEKEDSNDNKININRITIPVLSIIAEKDDLVSPMSSLAINDYLESHEKKVLRHPGGHISLCISDQAHKVLWPKVSNWIKS
jgi:polyhydroxyalkanoate synthase subunit PhaC